MTETATSWRERVCGIGDEAAPDLAGQLAIHRELGMNAIELRTVDGAGLHRLGPDDLSRLVEEIRGSGLEVAVVDTPVGDWSTTVASDPDAELAVLTRSAHAARALGCRYLRVMSYPTDGRPEPEWAAESLRRMRVLAREAERLDVVLLHENCQGWAGQGAAQTLRMLREVDHPNLRLLFDLGNGLAYGYRGVEMLAAVRPWVEHVHVKDGRRTPDGAVFDVPGEGEVEVAECVRRLERSGYRGRYSLEPHVLHQPHLGRSGAPEHLAAGYRACAEGFRRVWTSVSAEVAGV